MGLWSCNVGIIRTVDKEMLMKAIKDLDASLIPMMSDDKQSLIERISKRYYLDDIVIHNPQYSILNESLSSHQPKRRSEGVVKKSVHLFNGCNGEGQVKKIIPLQITPLMDVTKKIGTEGQ